jgi:hypothetical protein
MRKKKFPVLPGNRKAKIFYYSGLFDENVVAVWWNKDVIQFYFWDGFSSSFNQVTTRAVANKTRYGNKRK